MVVTELGIIKGSTPSLAPELREALEAALAAQTKWLDISLPKETRATAITGGRAWLFQQREDPGKVLLAARWKTVAQHNTWAVEEPCRESILGNIGKNLYQFQGDPAGSGDRDRDIKQEEQPAVTVVHVDSDIFQDGSPLLDSPVISITRTFVKTGQRAAFQSTFDRVGAYPKTYPGVHGVQTGWRVDREEDGGGLEKDEFVVVCGWPSLEAHMDLGRSAHIDAVDLLEQHIDGRDVRHYRRIL